MQTDRRNEPRTDANGLAAKMTVFLPNGSMLVAEATLLNVSRTGIKLRVKKPLIADSDAKVQIETLLPDAGIPVIVNAVIVHNKFDSEFGIHYIDVRPEDPLEQLISECENVSVA